MVDARLAVAGFVQIERHEMRQLNGGGWGVWKVIGVCLLYTSPSPRD